MMRTPWLLALPLLVLAANGGEAAAAGKKGVWMCSGYHSTKTPAGEPYITLYPVGSGHVWVHRHLGIDFCGPVGTPVISSTHGKVVWTGSENCGGGIIVETDLGRRGKPIYAVYWHMNPAAGLLGRKLGPGDVIGAIQDPKKIAWWKKCVGPVPHVHYALRTTLGPSLAYLNPNRYWAGGAGKFTCFRAKSRVPAGRAVAPVKCWGVR